MTLLTDVFVPGWTGGYHSPLCACLIVMGSLCGWTSSGSVEMAAKMWLHMLVQLSEYLQPNFCMIYSTTEWVSTRSSAVGFHSELSSIASTIWLRASPPTHICSLRANARSCLPQARSPFGQACVHFCLLPHTCTGTPLHCPLPEHARTCAHTTHLLRRPAPQSLLEC